MQRALENLCGRAELDNFSEIHHGDAIGDVFDDGEIVRNENQRQLHLARELARAG